MLPLGLAQCIWAFRVEAYAVQSECSRCGKILSIINTAGAEIDVAGHGKKTRDAGPLLCTYCCARRSVLKGARRTACWLGIFAGLAHVNVFAASAHARSALTTPAFISALLLNLSLLLFWTLRLCDFLVSQAIEHLYLQ
jgi:hypothetical protein